MRFLIATALQYALKYAIRNVNDNQVGMELNGYISFWFMLRCEYTTQHEPEDTTKYSYHKEKHRHFN
jgi:hypothetical protein